MRKITKLTLLPLLSFICVNTSVLANTLVDKDGNEVIIKYRDAKPYYEDGQRGWFFYEEPEIIVKDDEEKEEEKEKIQATKVQQQPIEEELSPREKLRKQGEAYEDAAALAVLNPTPENYRDYLAKSKKLLNQAQIFANGIEQYVYTDPSFDTQLNLGQGQDIQMQNKLNNQQKSSQLRGIAQNNAILFYYRSDCPYCHRYAPIIKKFASDHGFMVVPMALDGKPLLPEYPNFRTDNQLAKRLEVGAVPALYLLNPKQNKVSTIGFGLSDYNKLGDKVLSASQRDYAQTQLASN